MKPSTKQMQVIDQELQFIKQKMQIKKNYQIIHTKTASHQSKKFKSSTKKK